MAFETEIVTGSAYWASYFINGDASGLTEKEKAEADAWLAKELSGELIDGDIVDVGDPYFSWSYGLYTGSEFAGGELVEYTVLYRVPA